MTVPNTAHGGAVTLSAANAYTGPGTHAAGTAAVNIAFANLAAYDTVGVSDDANPAAGNLDGFGYSFSAQALSSVGVIPGASIAGFTWPNIPSGQPDTVNADGQIMTAAGSGTSLSFLGAGTFGTQTGTVTVTYTDGSTSTAPITLADWYADAAVPGCTLAVTAPYWNRPPGSTFPANHQVSLYATSVPLTAGKQIAYVTLPSNTQVHLFATAVNS